MKSKVMSTLPEMFGDHHDWEKNLRTVSRFWVEEKIRAAIMEYDKMIDADEWSCEMDKLISLDNIYQCQRREALAAFGVEEDT